MMIWAAIWSITIEKWAIQVMYRKALAWSTETTYQTKWMRTRCKWLMSMLKQFRIVWVGLDTLTSLFLRMLTSGMTKASALSRTWINRLSDTSTSAKTLCLQRPSTKSYAYYSLTRLVPCRDLKSKVTKWAMRSCMTYVRRWLPQRKLSTSTRVRIRSLMLELETLLSWSVKTTSYVSYSSTITESWVMEVVSSLRQLVDQRVSKYSILASTLFVALAYIRRKLIWQRLRRKQS